MCERTPVGGNDQEKVGIPSGPLLAPVVLLSLAGASSSGWLGAITGVAVGAANVSAGAGGWLCAGCVGLVASSRSAAAHTANAVARRREKAMGFFTGNSLVFGVAMRYATPQSLALV
jgi:hypothetical protein